MKVALDNSPTDRPSLFNLPVIVPPREGVTPIHHFPDIASKPKNKIFYYQDYRHKQVSGESGGGVRGAAWQSFHQVTSYGEEDILSVSDTNFLFDTMEHALDNKGQQKKNFFSILSDMHKRIPRTMSGFIGMLSPEQQQRFRDFESQLSNISDELHNSFRDLCNITTSSIRVLSAAAKVDCLLMRGKGSL